MFRNYFDVIITLAEKDFKLRYKNSVLGFLWSLLNPLAYMVILTAVFGYLFRSTIPNYAGWLLLALLVWRFFSISTSQSMFSIVNNPSFITKVYLPRYLLVLATNVSSLIGSALEFVTLIPVMLFLGIRLTSYALLVPVLIASEFWLIFGVSLTLATLNLKYRDFYQLWDIGLQLGFFLCPIVYDPALIPSRFSGVYMLNPVTRIIGAVRNLFFARVLPNASDYLVILLSSVIATSIGFVVFHVYESKFAEEL